MNGLSSASEIEAVAKGGPFSPDWPSLKAFRVPDWYCNGKFGIFVHWGVYSVPAFGNEWYPRNMYLKDMPEYHHHLRTYGSRKDFGYKDFIPKFTCENFDPSAYADLFKRAGARFVVPVAEHHDGFPLYDCRVSDWTAVKMGPKRDLVGELAESVRDAGLTFGVSSHYAENYWFYEGGRTFDSDVNDDANRGLYGVAAFSPEDRQHVSDTPPSEAFLQSWLVRTCQLIDTYRPNLIWFDWWIQNVAFKPYLKTFAAYYYNRAAEWGEEVAINHKFAAFEDGTAVYDVERGRIADIRENFWQSDTSISKNSWGYIDGHDYKTVTSLVGDLVDVVSKNGALLLNVGPKADGTIPRAEREALLEVGDWLGVNGEAIYGSRPWRVFGEGPTTMPDGSFSDGERVRFTERDIRFTRGDGAVYAIVLAKPRSSITITSLADDAVGRDDAVSAVTMLGMEGVLKWSRDGAGLHVSVPDGIAGDHAWCLKIAVNG